MLVINVELYNTILFLIALKQKLYFWYSFAELLSPGCHDFFSTQNDEIIFFFNNCSVLVCGYELSKNYLD